MIERYGITEHIKRFPSERACLDHLVNVRWDGKPQCPNCGNNYMNYYLSTRDFFKCSKCSKQFSVKTGTIFQSSKIDLSIWFKAIYFMVSKKRGVSSIQLAEWLELNQKTTWFILHRLRESERELNDIMLDGIYVEADETLLAPIITKSLRLQFLKKKHYDEQDRIHGFTDKKARNRFGPRKGGIKKGTTKAMLQEKKRQKELLGERKPFEIGVVIFGCLERGGRVVLRPVGLSDKDKTRETITPLLKRHISPDSILLTDQSSVYDYAKGIFKGHLTVNHSKKQYVAPDGTHTNEIEGCFSHFKRVVNGTYFHLSKQHLPLYLHEHTFRWNYRSLSSRERFDTFLPLVIGKRLKIKELTSRSSIKNVA